MPALVLDSLEIQGFRCFRHLQIKHLGRVNLITGKNNVGKTAFLEALRLYARRGSPTELVHLLVGRDETPRSFNSKTDSSLERVLDLRHLFYGRTDLRDHPDPITIGSLYSPADNISVSIRWPWRQLTLPTENGSQSARDDKMPHVLIQIASQTVDIPFDLRTLTDFSFTPFGLENRDISDCFVWSVGIKASQISRWWDEIALTDLEEHVLASLRILAPTVERVSLVGRNESNAGRVPIVKVAGSPEPIPLRSMGEGMNRLFGLILALVNCRNGILLVDEVESGLHFSVQVDMWRLVFQTAQRLNVQVFATTHSYDCIQAFQQAAAEDHGEEALLIRLENKNGDVVPTLFDERKLSIATREEIEVR